eukprot:scaffold2055_cov224-Chaetoceros_neogracile.AAC.6
MDKNEKIASFDPLNLAEVHSQKSTNFDMKPVMASLVALAALAPVANAAGPDWGIFEGRTLSLLHPAMMGGTFLFSCSTALLGFQYRRQRTMGDDISVLKKSLPNLGGASNLNAAIAQAETGETPDTALAFTLKAALPIQAEIDAMLAERKDLSKKGVKDSHFSQGALLAFIGTTFAIEGPLNTYARAGKLFPGPHLYAGAGLVVLWAAAAACVPAMQKGNDTARSIHIAANVSGIGLFAWQLTTGWPILQKVLQFTQWP